MHKPVILFIDDEYEHIDSFIDEFEIEYSHKYNIEYKSDLDSANEFILEHKDSIVLIILDLMIQAGQVLEDYDTFEGLRSGLFFKKVIRKYSDSIKIIIFTNFSYDNVLHDRMENEHNCTILQKQEFLPFQLSSYVKGILEAGSNS